MKVYVFPADTTGCGNYRLIWATQRLIERGENIQLVLPHQRDGMLRAEFDIKTSTVTDVHVPPDADVMVFQRVTHIFLAQAITLLRQRGIAVVVDVDDDLSRIDPGNPVFEVLHPRGVRLGLTQHSWQATEDACDGATLTQLSTPALLRRYGRRGQGRVLPNYVPASYLDVQHDDVETIGYGGALATHPNDVPVLGGALARIQSDGYEIHTVGDTRGIERVLGLSRQVIPAGPLPGDEYIRAIARFGVGIAPLADTEFNRAKSWLKPLELAAAGTPWVASPRVEYARLHILGCGALAHSPNEWYRELRNLLRDPARRADESARGRAVAAGLTIEDHINEWWDLWTEAYEIEQSGTMPIPPQPKLRRDRAPRTVRARPRGRRR